MPEIWPSKLLRRHRAFVADFATMMSGKSISASIALFTMPIVARFFTPTDFGIAAVYLSIIGIASNIAAFRYETALVLPKDHEQAQLLLVLCYRVLFATCTVTLFAVVLYDISGYSWSAMEMLGYWMYFLPLGIMLMAALQIQEAWLARQQAFKVIASTTVLGTSINSGVRIGLGAFQGSSVFALILSNLLGMGCRLVIQNSASKEGLGAAFKPSTMSELRQIARQYSDFPLLNAPAALVFSFGQNLPVLLFGALYAPAVAGFYAMANRLSQAPMIVVASSMRRVFLQKAAAINNRGGSLRKAFLLTTIGLALLGIVPFGTLWLFGQAILELVLGRQWSQAGHYLSIMSPWLLMIWVTSPCNAVFIVLRKQKLWLWIQSGLTLVRIAAIGVAFLIGAEAVWTLKAFVAATVAGNVATLLIAYVLIM
ncbi:MAG: oligosaccharide flippase family protein, partial [Woeseiaceae bacterium]